MKLNIGCGRNIMQGWINVDREKHSVGVDIATDLDADTVELPIDTNRADEFLLSHIIEHIRKPLPLMQELHRIAKPGARMVIRTPYGSSDDAWEDPTHVRPYFMQSFGYFSQPFYWRADYGYRGDWRVKTLNLFVSEARARKELPPMLMLDLINRERNVVTEMVAELEAVKPIREPKAELQDKFPIQLVSP